MKTYLIAAAAIAAAIAATPAADAQGVVGTFQNNTITKTAQPDAVSSPWPTDALSEIPADDSGKWQVILFTSPNCPPCDNLKADFAKHPALKALASDTEKAWAHLTVYSITAKSQQFRFQDWDVMQTPVVCVTPPPNSRTWPYYEVARRTGYNGQPDQLAHELVDAIATYARRFGPATAAAEPPPPPIERDRRPQPDQGQDDPPPAPPPPRPTPQIRPGPNILPNFPPILKPQPKPTPEKAAPPRKTAAPNTTENAARLDLLIVIKEPTSFADHIEARHVIKRVQELSAGSKLNWSANCITYKAAPPELRLRPEELPAVFFFRNGHPIFQMALGTFKQILLNADAQPTDPAFGALIDTLNANPNKTPPPADAFTVNLRGPLTWTWNALQILAVIGFAYVAIRAITRTRADRRAHHPPDIHGAQSPDA